MTGQQRVGVDGARESTTGRTAPPTRPPLVRGSPTFGTTDSVCRTDRELGSSPNPYLSPAAHCVLSRTRSGSRQGRPTCTGSTTRFGICLSRSTLAAMRASVISTTAPGRRRFLRGRPPRTDTHSHIPDRTHSRSVGRTPRLAGGPRDIPLPAVGRRDVDQHRASSSSSRWSSTCPTHSEKFFSRAFGTGGPHPSPTMSPAM